MFKLFFSFILILFLVAGCGPGDLKDEIVGKQWTVKTIQGKGIIESAKPSDITPFDNGVSYLIFTESMEVSGSTGCTAFMSGAYTITDNQISIDPKVTTPGNCPEPTEKNFLEALKLVNKAKIEDKNLTLFDGDKEVMTLVATAKVSVIKQTVKDDE